MQHRLIDEQDRSLEIVFVVEMADEVAQSFCGVGCQMVDSIKAVTLKQRFDKCTIGDGAPFENDPMWHIFNRSSRQIIYADHLKPCEAAMLSDV
jgi:hypothetical protein